MRTNLASPCADRSATRASTPGALSGLAAMRVGVVIATKGRPELAALVVQELTRQTAAPDAIVIAVGDLADARQLSEIAGVLQKRLRYAPNGTARTIVTRHRRWCNSSQHGRRIIDATPSGSSRAVKQGCAYRSRRPRGSPPRKHQALWPCGFWRDAGASAVGNPPRCRDC